jgi:hypothetical protein
MERSSASIGYRHLIGALRCAYSLEDPVMKVSQGVGSSVRASRRRIAAMLLAAAASGLAIAPAAAKTVVVKVSAKSAPWDPTINKRLSFGVGDARPPTTVWGAGLVAGLVVRFTASGSGSWIGGGRSFGPQGDSSLAIDKSLAYLPSFRIKDRKGPVYMLQLIGAFVDADGQVLGQPFAIGAEGSAKVPDGAVAISLGVNDDKMSDNSGTFTVSIFVPEPSVTVESEPAK